MFSGTTTCGELCQPAASRISRAMAPGLTHLLISARCLFMASMLTVGMTNAAPVPRAVAGAAQCSLIGIIVLGLAMELIDHHLDADPLRGASERIGSTIAAAMGDGAVPG